MIRRIEDAETALVVWDALMESDSKDLDLLWALMCYVTALESDYWADHRWEGHAELRDLISRHFNGEYAAITDLHLLAPRLHTAAVLAARPLDEKWRLINDYDYQAAMHFASKDSWHYVRGHPDVAWVAPDRDRGDAEPFGWAEVKSILAESPGDNDGDSWLLLGELYDGRRFFIEAGCDYIGWDGQSGGSAQVGSTMDNVIRYGLDDDARRRLRVSTTD